MSDGAIAGPSAGVLLRRARESAGLHVAALAASLKVPVRKLEALEEDRYDQLPDAVFARALASSVCRTLKVDPQPILSQLPQTSAPRLTQDHEGLNAPFRAPGDAPGPRWFDHLTQPVFLAVFALLLGALILMFLPSLRREEAMADKADAEAGGATPAVMAETPSAQPQPSTAASPAPVAQAPASASVVAVPVVAPSAAAPVAAASAALAQKPAGQPSATGLIVFKTRGASWIEVTDGKGTVALRRLMAAGETAGASGTPPLAVTIGSVSATEVEVRGKPFNLGPVSRDNVARFEVK